MNDRLEKINNEISKIGQAKSFLVQKVEVEPVYRELIDTLDSLVDRLEFPHKPVVKIVSPSLILAESLQQQHEVNKELRSLYEFQIVAPITQIRQILHHCDLICLLYSSHHQIRDHHQKLIELARQQNISLFLLVQQSDLNIDKINGDRYVDWLTQQVQALNDWVKLPLNDFIDLDHQQQLDVYQRSLTVVFSTVEASYLTRIKAETAQAIQDFFQRETANAWQEIKYIRNEYLGGQLPHLYQQQLKQTIHNSSQLRQQIVRDLKQEINHAKAELLNPFTCDGIIFNLQQLIDSAQVNLIKEADETYLYLTLNNFPKQPFIHDYILDFCQQKIDEILANQWSQINQVYASGGLKTLRLRINQELDAISTLSDLKSNFTILENTIQPKLDLRQIVEPYCLKLNSRIVFDYSYVQSSWFRLLISVLLGIGIYLITWLYFGEGKYLGFIIIFFQVINLITGQNIKKAKLKQQSKELKRLVEQKYQSLVRIIINQLIQTLTIEVDRQCQVDQEEWLQAIAIAQNKLDQLKQTSEQYKSKVESLKQDRNKIQSWFK